MTTEITPLTANQKRALVNRRNGKWDRRFLKLAGEIATWSLDPSTQVGAVIVRPDRTVASIGYNGFPRGMSDDPALYADRETKLSRVVHAEMNAILNAHSSVDGFTLYTSKLPPCDRCAVHVIQAGIRRVVYDEPAAELMLRWGDSIKTTLEMFAEAGVETVSYA